MLVRINALTIVTSITDVRTSVCSCCCVLFGHCSAPPLVDTLGVTVTLSVTMHVSKQVLSK